MYCIERVRELFLCFHDTFDSSTAKRTNTTWILETGNSFSIPTRDLFIIEDPQKCCAQKE